MADIKVADIETNNGLLREVRSARFGSAELVSIEIEFADYFTAGPKVQPLTLRLDADFRSLDTSQPMRVTYHERDRREIVDGVAVYNPIFIRDCHIDLYYQEKPDRPAMARLTTAWIKPGRKIKIDGALLARHREVPANVAVPQLF